MKIDLKFGKWRAACAVLLLSAPMLVACAKSTVPVPIHGVNHRAEAFSYVLVDPTNPENTGGGELVEPFSAGGTMCCYTLPAKWRPGIQVEIRETHYLPRLQDGTLPEVTKKSLVTLPPYASGEAGEIWVIRAPDGAMDIVSSNYQPDHANWPGKIRGWPVPSIEYQRARADMYIEDASKTIELMNKALEDLSKSPKEEAQAAWDITNKNRPADIKQYGGPADPAYLSMLKGEYEDTLAHARETLKNEKENRP